MIKPINISSLNTSNELSYICDNCGETGVFKSSNIINTDDNGNPVDGLYDYRCPMCDYNLKNPVAMHLESESFNLIKNGHKTIEIRLNDPKRKSLEIGDIIEFISKKTDEIIKAEIIDLLRHKSFDDLFTEYPVTDFGSNNKENLIKSIRKYYNEEDESKYGVLGIKIKLV